MEAEVGDVLADQLAIREVVERYGFVLDHREWDQLVDLFAPEAVFDGTDAGLHMLEGLTAIRDFWSGPDVRHPIGHHATNIEVSLDDEEHARARSKGISIFGTDSGLGVSSVEYYDQFVRTGIGWRIAHRRAIRRGP
jgi:hypothetical protein